ncbi:MAG: hypothetical protein A4E39_00888 [Methanoregulaceae archaeon PtaB.Bin152]|nr:MAG: hypothetical protein A4E39_00888 [Methanoregulaceae archaeon PtaB.Bin152]
MAVDAQGCKAEVRDHLGYAFGCQKAYRVAEAETFCSALQAAGVDLSDKHRVGP